MHPFEGRPLPTWWSDAGLGIFVHWGPYSVPAWAPVGPDPFTRAEADGWEVALRETPYAEWAWNSMSLPGSPTAVHHAAEHGDAGYESFVAAFRSASLELDADAWGDLFARCGAGYVVLTTKHHDGFLLWDAATPNPHRRAWQATRDLVGEVAAASRAHGMRFGAYYSGGLDWTFGGLGIDSFEAMVGAIPRDDAYRRYVRAHWRELVERHRPDVLWNDIHHPGGSRDAHELFAEYYAAVPDGVVNDRFDVLRVAGGEAHADHLTPEYSPAPAQAGRPFEVCRALGTSFGWNRAEADDDLLTAAEVVDLLVDVRSRGGNLLLDVGPTAHGSIPSLQRERLEDLATWMVEGRRAVVGARPWAIPAVLLDDGRTARFTEVAGTLFATVVGPGPTELRLEGMAVPSATDVRLLGHGEPLAFRSDDGDLVVEVPSGSPLDAPVLSIFPAPALP